VARPLGWLGAGPALGAVRPRAHAGRGARPGGLHLHVRRRHELLLDAAAGCVDCHLPHDLVGKYRAKASNGYHHSKGFTLQDFHEPIQIKPKNAAILQAACLRCHGDFVHDIVSGATTDRDAVTCVHCHRGVGHGARY